MSNSLRTVIEQFIVSVVLIGLGFVDVSESMSAAELRTAEAIRYVVCTYWLPGLLGLTLPAVLFWGWLKAVQSRSE